VTEADRPERLPRSNLGEEVYRLLWKRILDHGLGRATSYLIFISATSLASVALPCARRCGAW
jgi:hypothetical protein